MIRFTEYTEGDEGQNIWSNLVQNTEPETTNASPSQKTKTRPRSKFNRPDDYKLDRSDSGVSWKNTEEEWRNKGRKETRGSIEKMNKSDKKYFWSENTKDSRVTIEVINYLIEMFF